MPSTVPWYSLKPQNSLGKMNDAQIEILKSEFDYEPPCDVIEKFKIYTQLFLDYNEHTNLMSKGDLELLFEKHIFDSLGILKYWSALGQKNALPQKAKILDVGTGGGFPSLILAICFENLEIIGVDSVGKKINFINLAKKELGLQNLSTICDRVENTPPLNANIITSRAVGKISDIFKNSIKHCTKAGVFVFYKAKKEVYEQEIRELNGGFGKKFNEPQIIPYTLPTREKHERALLIFDAFGTNCKHM